MSLEAIHILSQNSFWQILGCVKVFFSSWQEFHKKIEYAKDILKVYFKSSRKNLDFGLLSIFTFVCENDHFFLYRDMYIICKKCFFMSIKNIWCSIIIFVINFAASDCWDFLLISNLYIFLLIGLWKIETVKLNT